MGALFSNEDEEDLDTLSLTREQLQQRQRAQLLLIAQLREQQAGAAGEGLAGLPPTQQPSLRQTKVFKNLLHVRARSVQLSCSTQPDGQKQWQLSFIFDALVPCEVIVHIGLGCGVEVRLPLTSSGGGDTQGDVVVAWSPPGEGGCGTSRWVSAPVFSREGLNQEYRGEVDLGEFATTPRDEAGNTGNRSRLRSQGFCVELKASAQRADSKDPISALEGAAVNLDVMKASEWTTGRFTRRILNQAQLRGPEDQPTSIAEVPGEVVEATINSQSVRLPEYGLAPCYAMHEVYGADTGGTILAQDCVICMVEPRDTAVLPCRHMCLCGQCAETMRSRVQYRSYRCPICRERVSSLLQVRSEKAFPNSNSSTNFLVLSQSGTPQGQRSNSAGRNLRRTSSGGQIPQLDLQSLQGFPPRASSVGQFHFDGDRFR